MAFRSRFALVITVLGLFGLILPPPSLAASCTTVPGNLVANCGFETGDFSSWTTVPAASGSFLAVLSDPHSGTYAAAFGASGGLNDYIYQNLATTAGTIYDVNFWVDASLADNNSQFVANWNGVNFLNLIGNVPGGYMDYNFLLPATSASTQLEFGGNNPPSFTFLDDVSVVNTGVTSTPEPSTIFLFASSLLALGGAIKRKVLA